MTQDDDPGLNSAVHYPTMSRVFSVLFKVNQFSGLTSVLGSTGALLASTNVGS